MIMLFGISHFRNLGVVTLRGAGMAVDLAGFDSVYCSLMEVPEGVFNNL